MRSFCAAFLHWWYQFFNRREVLSASEKNEKVVAILFFIIMLWPFFILTSAVVLGLLWPCPVDTYEFPISNLVWVVLSLVVAFPVFSAVVKLVASSGGEVDAKQRFEAMSERRQALMVWLVRLFSMPLVGFFVAVILFVIDGLVGTDCGMPDAG